MFSNGAFTLTEQALLPILAELKRREPIFHRPAVASTSAHFDALMAAGYWEVGASGRRYGRAFILQHLAETPPVDATAVAWRSDDFACRRLGPDTYLLTYTLEQGTRKSRRATIWQHMGDQWQIVYHQGTLVSVDEDDVPSSPSSAEAHAAVKQ